MRLGARIPDPVADQDQDGGRGDGRLGAAFVEGVHDDPAGGYPVSMPLLVE